MRDPTVHTNGNLKSRRFCHNNPPNKERENGVDKLKMNLLTMEYAEEPGYQVGKPGQILQVRRNSQDQRRANILTRVC